MTYSWGLKLATNEVLEIIKVQNSIKLDDLEYRTKKLPFIFIKEIYDGNFSLKKADGEQSHLFMN